METNQQPAAAVTPIPVNIVELDEDQSNPLRTAAIVLAIIIVFVFICCIVCCRRM